MLYSVVLKERRDTTRWLLATLSVLVFVALGLGLWLARHSLGLAHSGGSHAPMVMQSAASPPPPRECTSLAVREKRARTATGGDTHRVAQWSHTRAGGALRVDVVEDTPREHRQYTAWR